MGLTPLRSVDIAEARPIYVPAHGKGRLKPFQPGQSGNPSGKGGLYQEALKICRAASPAAARRLVELLDSPDDRVALLAAEKVLDRAWGKVKETPPSDAVSVEDAERRAAVRAALIGSLDSLARSEPLNQQEIGQRQALPSRGEQRQLVTGLTDPPAPDTW